MGFAQGQTTLSSSASGYTEPFVMGRGKSMISISVYQNANTDAAGDVSVEVSNDTVKWHAVTFEDKNGVQYDALAVVAATPADKILNVMQVPETYVRVKYTRSAGGSSAQDFVLRASAK